MNESAGLWLVLVVGALISGASIVGMLVVRRAMELPTVAVGGLGFGAAGWAFVGIASAYAAPDAIVWALAFGLAAAVGGYALASTLLYRLAETPGPPKSSESRTGEAAGVAVIVVSCIEPSAYDPRATAGMLQSLADEGLLDASMGALPLMFFGQKARYRAVGGASPSEAQVSAITAGVERTLPEAYQVEWATCAGDRSLPIVVQEAASRGHSRIIVAELGVAESLHLAQAKSDVAGLRLENLGITVAYTGAVSNSERIVALVARRVADTTDNPATTGVVLVGHGQPEERARRNRDFDELELAFLNRVKLALVEQGFNEPMVRVAWADWSEPDVTSSVRHVAALGARMVLVCPAVYPVDTLATRLDLELAVRRARLADGSVAMTLPAWRDDPAVIAELHARIDALAP